MFNVKWGGIAAGAAFALALALSLILGQTSLLIALLRAVVFAALFFGFGIGAWSLINTFIPELLSVGAGGSAGGDIASKLFATGSAGSQVDITVDDMQNAALPEQGYGAADGSDVGDFNELFTRKEDIDQTPATGYTEEGEAGMFASGGELSPEEGEFSSAFDDDAGFNDKVSLGDEGEDDEAGGFSMDFSAFVPGGLDDGDGDGGGEGESDADADMDSFSFFPEAGGGSTMFEEPAVPERKVARNKPMQLEGDFNAKEIAAGLRTVLEKDKKG